MPRIDLCVPFHEKDQARKLGARWDPRAKVWFVPDGISSAPLQRWLPNSREINTRSSSYSIVQAATPCWKCGESTSVFGFVLPSGHETFVLDEDEAEEPGAWEVATLLVLPHYIEHLSWAVTRRIRDLSPLYRVSFSRATRSAYWMNHCERCGMQQGDHGLFCEPDGAFVPLSEAAAAALRLHEILEPFEASAGAYAYDPDFLNGR